MNLNKEIPVSKVLQVIEENLKFNKSLRLHEAFRAVSNTYNELLDLDYSPVDLSINEFIYEIENADYLSNVHEHRQVIEVLLNELLDYYIEISA